jgi:hypothetical protein
VLLIFAITLVGVLYPVFKERRKRKKPANAAEAALANPTVADPARARSASIFSLIVVVMLGLALWQSRNFGYRAGLFPWVIGIPALVLAAVQFFMDVSGKTRFKAADETGVGADLPANVVKQRTVNILLWTVGFFLAIWLLGFSVAVPLTTVLYLKIAGREKWPITIAVAFCSWAFFYFLFVSGLHVPFPDPLIPIPYITTS